MAPVGRCSGLVLHLASQLSFWSIGFRFVGLGLRRIGRGGFIFTLGMGQSPFADDRFFVGGEALGVGSPFGQRFLCRAFAKIASRSMPGPKWISCHPPIVAD